MNLHNSDHLLSANVNSFVNFCDLFHISDKYILTLLLLLFINILTQNAFVTLEHKTSVKSLGYICSNNQKYILWVKIIKFYFMPKIIRILRSCSMKIFSKFPIVNILKLHF